MTSGVVIADYPGNVRASRLVGLLGLLQARGRMTASQLAGELEVSPRTVLRDIEALNSAGFPIYAIRGSRGGFELLAGFASALPASSLAYRPASPPADHGQRALLRISTHGRRIAALTGKPAGLRVRRNASPASRRDGWAQAWIPVESADAVISDVLALAGEAELIHPADLRRRIQATALKIANLHDAAGSSSPGSD
jgi:predicted DNA-binding transcriptional regulator YafY